MKVLYIAGDWSSRPRTAAQVRVAALLPALAATTDLRVIGFCAKDESSFEISGNHSVIIEPAYKRPLSRARLIAATFMSGPRAFRRFNIPGVRAQLGVALREHQPDIVHLDGFSTLGLMSFVLRVQPSTRIVAHVHDAQSARLQRYTKVGSVIMRLQYLLEYRKAIAFEKRHMGQAAITLVDSKEDRDYLRETAGIAQVAVLPLGFDPTVFKANGTKADLEQPAIVYSGSMKGQQSIDAALFLANQVLPLVWMSYPEAQLYIVGGGVTEEVKALTGERIHITGFVDDLASYLRASNVYVCPLRLGSGMRTRVVEALACGCVIVATPMAIQGLETGKRASAWMTCDTPADFARHIINALDGEYTEIGADAALYARAIYSWRTVAAKLVKYYSRVIGQ